MADATYWMGSLTSSSCVWPFIDCGVKCSCMLRRLYHKAHTFVSQTLPRVCFILLQGRHGRGKPQYISKKTYFESAETDSRLSFFAIAQNDKARWLVISNVLEASPGTLSGRQVSTIMNSHDQDQHSSSSTCPTPCHPERSEGGSQISWHTAPYSGVPPPVTLSAAKGPAATETLRCAQGDKREVTSVE